MALITRLGTLVGPLGTRYPLTTTDRWSLARIAAQEEGTGASYEAAHAIGSVVLRRLAVVNAQRAQAGRGPRWNSVDEFLHDYAHWPPGPERARAQRIYRTPYSELPGPLCKAADDLVRGRGALSAPEAVHWGAPGDPLLTEAGLPRRSNLHVVPSPAANILLSTEQSRRLPEPHVEGSGGGALGVLSGLAGLGVGLGLVYALHRWRAA